MFNPEKDTIAHCQGCQRIMIVPKDEPIQEWIASLGFKHTGKFWHSACLHEELNKYER